MHFRLWGFSRYSSLHPDHGAHIFLWYLRLKGHIWTRMATRPKTGLAVGVWSSAAIGLTLTFAMPAAWAGESLSHERLEVTSEVEQGGAFGDGDFNVNLEAAEWNDGSGFWAFPESGADSSLPYFTPRLGSLQLGPSYLPSADLGVQESDPTGPSGDDRNFALSVNLSETIGGVNVGLGGDFRSARSQTFQYDPALGVQPDSQLRRYGVNLNLGYGSFTVTGAYAKEVTSNLIEGDIWDAGIAYDTGAWTFGVNYLYSQFEATSPAFRSDDEIRAISGEVSYSIGPGFHARAQLSHAQWENSTGAVEHGTVGILGFRYNF